jgi:hypothetical protein
MHRSDIPGRFALTHDGTLTYAGQPTTAEDAAELVRRMQSRPGPKSGPTLTSPEIGPSSTNESRGGGVLEVRDDE